MNEDRSRELVDPEALARWMDARGLPGAGAPVGVRFISGGASNEIFEIVRGDVRLALRRPPREVPKGRNESMLREYRVLAALRDTDVPHARALAACDDPSVLGACFYLMEYVDGWSCMNRRAAGRRRSTPTWRRAHGLAYELVDAIAKLGQVDWRARGLEGFGQPGGFSRAPGRPLARPSRRLQVPRHPRPRRRRRLAARLPAEVVPPGHHPRRLPVRQRHVPPRRAGAHGGDRRLGDGDDRRPVARSRLGDHGLAEPRRGSCRLRVRRLHGHADARGARRPLRAHQRAAGRRDRLLRHPRPLQNGGRARGRLRALRAGRGRQPEDGRCSATSCSTWRRKAAELARTTRLRR